jgi:glycosyltransferase involved in cell wall biosynthesis
MIPKILHQIWIGPLETPLSLTLSWKEKYPDYEYILWDEEKCKELIIDQNIQNSINKNNEWNGKADIYRWLILYEYGGIFQDIDSICIEQIPDTFLKNRGFAGFENEKVRENLIATGTMGFIPKHELIYDILTYMKTDSFIYSINKVLSWQNCGPGVLTDFLNTGKYKDFCVYPSYYFLPIHHTGLRYEGHKKVYAHQLWCTNFRSYENYSKILPEILYKPNFYISVLVSSYNTNPFFIKECIESLLLQEGDFGIEVVWINDGSEYNNTDMLIKSLNYFKDNSRFCNVIYKNNQKNRGTYYSLNQGVLLCSNEFIFKLDSDDIMTPDRLKKQLLFMKNNTEYPFCSTNIILFKNPNDDFSIKQIIEKTKNKEIITWEDFIKEKYDWFSNHCSMCFRKDAVLSVGNYNIKREPLSMMEDYELELKLLKKYGKTYNIQECLLYYRIHKNQLTQKNNCNTKELIKLREKIIFDVINN